MASDRCISNLSPLGLVLRYKKLYLSQNDTLRKPTHLALPNGMRMIEAGASGISASFRKRSVPANTEELLRQPSR